MGFKKNGADDLLQIPSRSIAADCTTASGKRIALRNLRLFSMEMELWLAGEKLAAALGGRLRFHHLCFIIYV